MDRREHDLRLRHRNRQLAVVEAVLRVVCFIVHRRLRRKNYADRRQLGIERRVVRDEIMCQINTNERCRDIIRM